MKTSISRIPIVIILPTALLLGQCAPNADTPQQLAGNPATSALHRTMVSFSPATHHPLEIISTGIGSVRFDDEPLPIDTEVLVRNNPDEWNVPQLSPVIVTASTYPDDFVEDWPTNAVDAELRSSWISLKQQEPSPRHPTEDSTIEWIRSLR